MEPKNDLRSVLATDAMRAQFARALPKTLSVDRFMRCLLTATQKVPELLDCDRHSFLLAAMQCAQLGLEIDTLGQAYILPYRDKKRGITIAQLIVGYRGLLALAYRSEQITGLQAQAVYSSDVFEVEFGLDPVLRHIPGRQLDRGQLVAAYAIATLKGGGTVWTVAWPSDIARAKGASRSAHSDYSPWRTAEPEMWAKTAIRKLAKLLPLTPELTDAIAADDSDSTYGDVISLPEPAAAAQEETPAQLPNATPAQTIEIKPLREDSDDERPPIPGFIRASDVAPKPKRVRNPFAEEGQQR